MLEKTQSPKNWHRVLGKEKILDPTWLALLALSGLAGLVPIRSGLLGLPFRDLFITSLDCSLRLSPGWPGWLHKQYCVSFTPRILILPRTWISVAFLSLCDRGSKGPWLVLGASKKKGFGYLATHLSPVVFENSPRQIWWPGQVCIDNLVTSGHFVSKPPFS